jgi:hypothetical protein
MRLKPPKPHAAVAIPGMKEHVCPLRASLFGRACQMPPNRKQASIVLLDTTRPSPSPFGVDRVAPRFQESAMVQTKITDENTLVKAGKKAHRQIQAVSQKIKLAKKEIAALRAEFDEKPPSNISAEDRKAYESIVKSARTFIDSDCKTAIKDAERLIVDTHATLNRLI